MASKRALIADDDEEVRDLVTQVVSGLGFDVIVAEDGYAALERAAQERPDLIILDVSMPALDGFSVLKRLRRDPNTSAIPVVMLTGLPPAGRQLEAWREGVRHYVTKPFEVRQLELAVNVAVRESREEAANAESVDRSVGQGAAPKPEAEQPGTSGGADSGRTVADRLLGAAIPLGSMVFLHGPPSSGKSFLSQYLTTGFLTRGVDVAYFASGESRPLSSGHPLSYVTSDASAQGLLAGMSSVGLDALSEYRSNALRIIQLKTPVPDDLYRGPETVISWLSRQVAQLQRRYRVIVFDDVSELASPQFRKNMQRFVDSCRRLCSRGRTVVLVAESQAFDMAAARHIRSMSEVVIRAGVELSGTKTVNTVTVEKAGRSRLVDGALTRFVVLPGAGFQTWAAEGDDSQPADYSLASSI